MEYFATTVSGIIAGVFGALAMNFFLRWVSASFDEPENMTKVLGSFFSGLNGRSIRTGSLLHLAFGAVFGIAYSGVLFGLLEGGFPAFLFSSIGIGFAHGILVSYGLMFVVGEKHPVRRYRNSTFSVGVLYLIAHVIYGTTTGFLLGLISLTPGS
jgi:hypothetical protein